MLAPVFRFALWAGLAVLCLSGAARADPDLVGTSKRFAVYCQKNANCDRMADIADQAQSLLVDMEAAYDWLKDLGFPVERATLNKVKGKMPIYITSGAKSVCADGNAVACTRTAALPDHRNYLVPANRLDGVRDDPGTLAHEYVHTLQPLVDKLGGADWMSEAAPTAIGTAYSNERRHLGLGFYPPIYLMSLDRPFYDVVDKGYGNWAYLLAVGESTGSRKRVAYLSNDAFLNVAKDFAGQPASAVMKLLYDRSLVGGETFDKQFPRFVALFNNIEASPAPGESRYNYYTDIREETFKVPDATAPASQTYDGKAMTYAVAPILMNLSVKVPDDIEPRDALMLASIEVTDGHPAEDLTLVIEHKRADRPRKEMFMLAGTEPPEGLGFLRIVNAPSAAKGDASSNAFKLHIETRPISFKPPDCIRAGDPAEFEPVGFNSDDAGNWRLRTDNGTADGTTITPAHEGKMKVTVEIDSPITRQSGSLAPKRPHKARIDLGTFDVASDACMVRLEIGPAQMTYTPNGNYTEAIAPSGEAVYFSSSDFAAYRNGSWISVPPMIRKMMIGKMMSRLSLPGAVDDDASPGIFMARMPKAFAQRFSWDNLLFANDPQGKPLHRRRAACPHGGSGCTATTLGMDGHPVPVTFDAQGRPVDVDFNGKKMRFEYGSWKIRRPPGW